jgi:hydroxyacylglutathione hydrolase
LLPQVRGHDAQHSKVWTLGEEKAFNTFLRLGSASVIAALRKRFSELPEQPDAQTVFIKLRELRNTW